MTFTLTDLILAGINLGLIWISELSRFKATGRLYVWSKH